MSQANAVIERFVATGQESCFHDRHINPQIYAGLNVGKPAPPRPRKPDSLTVAITSSWVMPATPVSALGADPSRPKILRKAA